MACDVPLLLGQLLRATYQVARVALESRRATLVQAATRLLQTTQCGRGLRRRLIALPGRRAPHRGRRIAEPARGFGQPLRRLLTRQTLELTRQLLRLLRQLPLRPAAGTGTRHLLGARTHALGLLLLTSGQLAEPLERLIDTAIRLLALAAFHLLVLIAKLVVLQLEKVGEILGVRLLSAHPASGLPLEAHLDLAVRRFRPLKMLKCLLLVRQGVAGLASRQTLLRLLHRRDRLRQLGRDLLHDRV